MTAGGDVSGGVDEQAEGQLSGRCHEALVGVSDDHAVRRGSGNIDGGDVDCGAQKRSELRSFDEEFGVAGRRAMSDDYLGTGCVLDQLWCGEVAVERVVADLDAERGELGKCSGVVRLEVLGIVGQQDSQCHRCRG